MFLMFLLPKSFWFHFCCRCHCHLLLYYCLVSLILLPFLLCCKNRCRCCHLLSPTLPDGLRVWYAPCFHPCWCYVAIIVIVIMWLLLLLLMFLSSSVATLAWQSEGWRAWRRQEIEMMSSRKPAARVINNYYSFCCFSFASLAFKEW